ncbi:Uncharacterised protein [Acinetobacter baumannii]|nr:Uncharacterised protein [Acinetobacter baumannii]
MTKKPLPLMARSNTLLVESMLPCLNICETSESSTPLPCGLLPEPSTEAA